MIFKFILIIFIYYKIFRIGAIETRRLLPQNSPITAYGVDKKSKPDKLRPLTLGDLGSAFKIHIINTLS